MHMHHYTGTIKGVYRKEGMQHEIIEIQMIFIMSIFKNCKIAYAIDVSHCFSWALDLRVSINYSVWPMMRA